jgi:GNAT superfamily N-acetyltransferase
MTCKHDENNHQNQLEGVHNPYKCTLCAHPPSKNGKGITCHIRDKHPEISFEAYYMKYMTPESLALIADKKIKDSKFPHEHRLTNVCLECGEATCNFDRFTRGFSVFCSETCASKNTLAKKIKKESTEEALLKKYGVANASQITGHDQRVRKTKEERYGDETYVNPEKARKTNIERYGKPSYCQTKEYEDKVKEVSLSKYGVEHFTQSEEVKAKAIATNMERYGVSSTLQVPEIRKKIEETNIEKYGVKSQLCLEEVRDKSKEINREKYGCDYPMQSSIVAGKAKATIRGKYVKNFKSKNITEIIPIDFSTHTYKCVYCDDIFQAENVSLNERAAARYPRCRKCFPVKDIKKYSIEEKEILVYLQSILPGVDIQHNVRGLLPSNPRLELDIYIPSKNLAIEYNGLRWHGENLSKKKNTYHKDKSFNFWKEKNIRIIHIFSDDWKNFKEIIKLKLAHIAGASQHKNVLHARKLNIFSSSQENSISKTKEISEKVRDFYDKNHIQGATHKSQTHIYALHNKEIVATMSFSVQPTYVELERFCADNDFIITGIASRLLNFYIDMMRNDPSLSAMPLVSFADICWTHLEENLYTKLGFTLEKILPPRYWYFKPNTESKIHRFNFRKEKLAKKFGNFDFTLTEWQNMVNNNYDRVWDCGLLRYVYKV